MTVDVEFVTGTLKCYDEDGELASGIPVEMQITALPGNGGLSFSTASRFETSDENGDVEFERLVRGASYKVRRGASVYWTSFTVPLGTDDPIAIDDLLGHDVH